MFWEIMRLQERLLREARGIFITFDSEPTHLSFLFAKKGNFRVFLATEKNVTLDAGFLLSHMS